MTDMLSQRGRFGRAGQMTLALVIGLGFASSALATEPKAPSSKSKLLRDRDVTIVIIDENDDKRSTSRIGAPSKPLSSPVRQPSGKIKRDDDVIKVYIKPNTGSGTVKRTGPKIIIVDKNSNGCDGGGVCVIRP